MYSDGRKPNAQKWNKDKVSEPLARIEKDARKPETVYLVNALTNVGCIKIYCYTGSGPSHMKQIS